MQRKQLIPSKFFQGTRKGSGFLPVRTIEVDTDATLGTNAFEDAVSLACLAVKQVEQIELEGIYAQINID